MNIDVSHCYMCIAARHGGTAFLMQLQSKSMRDSPMACFYSMLRSAGALKYSHHWLQVS